MNFEKISNLENKYLKVGDIFEEDNLIGEVLEKKSIHQFNDESLKTFSRAETAYKQGSVDTAWIKRGGICYRIVRVD